MKIIDQYMQAICHKLRSCVFCSEYSFLRPDRSFTNSKTKFAQLCEDCHLKLEICKLEHPVRGYNFKVMSLYKWDDAGDELLRAILLGLKGGGPKELFLPFAEKLSLLNLKLNENRYTRPGPNKIMPRQNQKSLERIVVPAPSRVGEKSDHAYTLAKQVAELTSYKFCPILRRGSQSQQKFLKMRARKENILTKNRIGYDGEIKLSSEAAVVFVDDVITTGATAQAAYEALGRPVQFEVWTIAYRPRLFV